MALLHQLSAYRLALKHPRFHQLSAVIRLPRSPGNSISLTLYGSVRLPSVPTLAIRIGISDTPPEALGALWPVIERKTIGELLRLAETLQAGASSEDPTQGSVRGAFWAKEWHTAFHRLTLGTCAHPMRHAADCECATLTL